jgi:hypothetical protein
VTENVPQEFAVGYYPDVFTKQPYILARTKTHVEALEVALGYSRMYYGECSPIMIFQGKRKIHTIPRNAARPKR